MSETINNGTVNAKVSFRSNKAWEHLGDITTTRATFSAVKISASVKLTFLQEINFAFACAAPCSKQTLMKN
jgi:hypothetical protein